VLSPDLISNLQISANELNPSYEIIVTNIAEPSEDQAGESIAEVVRLEIFLGFKPLNFEIQILSDPLSSLI
jgi:hypothetical protein